MNPRGLRRYVDDLLRGRRPRSFRPDDFEAAQIRTAIELRASRPGDDNPARSSSPSYADASPSRCAICRCPPHRSGGKRHGGPFLLVRRPQQLRPRLP